MKRHLIFCIALVAVMASCVKEPQIYRKLTAVESAAIPYQMGQTLQFVDQDGDTLCFTVVSDTTFVADSYDERDYNPNQAKMEIIPRPYFYMREVVLQGPPEDSCLLRCIVAPEKVVSISYEIFAHDVDIHGNPINYWHTVLGRSLPLSKLPTGSFSLGETVFENVYYDEGSYSWNDNGGSWAWYYSEQAGLLSAKDRGISLTLVP